LIAFNKLTLKSARRKQKLSRVSCRTVLDCICFIGVGKDVILYHLGRRVAALLIEDVRHSTAGLYSVMSRCSELKLGVCWLQLYDFFSNCKFFSNRF